MAVAVTEKMPGASEDGQDAVKLDICGEIEGLFFSGHRCCCCEITLVVRSTSTYRETAEVGIGVVFAQQ